MATTTRALRALGFAGALLITTSASAQTAPPPAAGSGDAPMPSFRSLFTDLPSDLRRLPTVTNGLWLGGTGAFALAVHPQDRRLTEDAFNSHGLETALDSGAAIGGGVTQIGAAFGTYLVGRFTDKPGLAKVGADLVRAQMINTVLTQGIKVAANRQRPNGGSYSFPSGHSASSFATATVLERHFGWKVGIPAYAVAGYVAGSRLTENKHFLSDVIFGAGIGIVAGRAVTVGHGSHEFAISPTVVRGGVGVSFTRVAQ